MFGRKQPTKNAAQVLADFKAQLRDSVGAAQYAGVTIRNLIRVLDDQIQALEIDRALSTHPLNIQKA